MMNTPMCPDPRDYEIRIWYSAEKGDECFIAQVVEWPGIMAHGATREEAAHQIQLALEGALEVAAEEGIKPPAPALAHVSSLASGHFNDSIRRWTSAPWRTSHRGRAR